MKKLIIEQKTKIVGSLMRFFKDRSAVAMTEFALMLPLLMLLAFGSFEVGRYTLLMQKLDRITATFSDLIARQANLTAAEIDDLFNSTDHLATPFDFDSNGMIVVTSVIGRDGDEPLVIAQRSKGSITGSSSEVGALNENASLPAVFTDETGQTLLDSEGVIVAEVFFNFEPYFAGAGSFLNLDVFDSKVIYRRAFFRPRLSDFTTF